MTRPLEGKTAGLAVKSLFAAGEGFNGGRVIELI